MSFQPQTRVSLTIHPNHEDIDWTRITLPWGKTSTLEELPVHLRGKVTRVVRYLIEMKTNVLSYDSTRAETVRLDETAVDLAILFEDCDKTFFLIDWWHKLERRIAIHRKDAYGKQPHTTWTCTCGTTCISDDALCTNPQCDTHRFWKLCTREEWKRPARPALLPVPSPASSNGNGRTKKRPAA